MREILFRGKKVDDKTWVRGYLSKSRMHGYKGNTLQLCIDHENNGVMLTSVVDSKTVGQWTGLTDKTGVKIFEGDVARNDGIKYKIKMQSACWVMSNKNDWDFLHTNAKDISVIGNIHDNPNLMEVQNNAKI